MPCGVSKDRSGLNQNINIMVISTNFECNFANARPCYKCLLMMKNIGIKKVYYSMDNQIICEKVEYMVSINTSQMSRNFERVYYNAPHDPIKYYQMIFRKMPQNIKKINVDYFVRHIREEMNGCNYTLTKTRLTVFINDNLIGTIMLF
jgi:hypothetical protein